MIPLSAVPPLLIVLGFSVAWLLVGVGTGWAGNRVEIRHLDHDTWITRPRAVEAEGGLYERALRIRRWKDLLPEGGAAFRNGFSKSHLPDRLDATLERFVIETRRAENVHWANSAAGPLFFVFQPFWVGLAMTAFGLSVHLPFVAVQRYNRIRLNRTLSRRRQRA